MTDDERERAWAAVHDAIARMPGWAVGPCQLHGEAASWQVAAVDLRPRGRQAIRESITATGATEKEVASQFFAVRLWDREALMGEIFSHYDNLPDELRAELPLKRIWTLAAEEQEA